MGEFRVSYCPIGMWQAISQAEKKLAHVSAIPFLRCWPQQCWYVEAGIGATLFGRTRTRIGDKNSSSAFQFGDYIGAGYQLSKPQAGGLRYSHFFNSDIRKLNPGLDLIQLTYTYRY